MAVTCFNKIKGKKIAGQKNEDLQVLSFCPPIFLPQNCFALQVEIGMRRRLQFSMRFLLGVVLVAACILAVIAFRFRGKPARQTQPHLVVRKERFGEMPRHRRIAIEVWFTDGSHETFRDYEPFGTLDEVLRSSAEGKVADFVGAEHPWLRLSPPRPLDESMLADFARLRELVEQHVDVEKLEWLNYLGETEAESNVKGRHSVAIPLSKDFVPSRRAKAGAAGVEKPG